MDTLSSEERSALMKKVKSNKNKSTELQTIKYFKIHGIKGWRRNYALEGKPDFVFLKVKVAIFVDGCFWHGCPDHCRVPQSNYDYWNNKINRNKNRDLEITDKLKNKDWTVVRIWEHDLKQKTYNKELFDRIYSMTMTI